MKKADLPLACEVNTTGNVLWQTLCLQILVIFGKKAYIRLIGLIIGWGLLVASLAALPGKGSYPVSEPPEPATDSRTNRIKSSIQAAIR
jgi:hypothetical protein